MAGCAHAAGVIPTAPDSSGSRAVMLTMPLRWQPGEMLRALDVFPRERESQRGWIHSNAAFFFLSGDYDVCYGDFSVVTSMVVTL